jgi:hypothetical protein
MIHRDHRKSYESASAFGQIMHNQGPRQLTAGDLDLYTAKWIGRKLLLKLLEHKQPDQQIGAMQAKVLMALDRVLRAAVINRPPGLELHPDSGVFILRGPLEAQTEGRKKVDFAGPQIVERLDGTIVLKPKTRGELFDWINGGPGWAPRAGAARYGGSLSI